MAEVAEKYSFQLFKSTPPDVDSVVLLGISEKDFDYFLEVFNASNNHDMRLICNRNSNHAAIVFYNLFRVAQQEVLILCGRLNDAVFGKQFVIDSAEDFLNKRNGKISIKVCDDFSLASSSRFFQSLSQKNCKSLTLTPAASSTAGMPHFTVVDGKSYRYEFAPHNCGFESSVRFGDEGISQALVKRFSEI